MGKGDGIDRPGILGSRLRTAEGGAHVGAFKGALGGADFDEPNANGHACVSREEKSGFQKTKGGGACV